MTERILKFFLDRMYAAIIPTTSTTMVVKTANNIELKTALKIPALSIAAT